MGPFSWSLFVALSSLPFLPALSFCPFLLLNYGRQASARHRSGSMLTPARGCFEPWCSRTWHGSETRWRRRGPVLFAGHRLAEDLRLLQPCTCCPGRHKYVAHCEPCTLLGYALGHYSLLLPSRPPARTVEEGLSDLSAVTGKRWEGLKRLDDVQGSRELWRVKAQLAECVWADVGPSGWRG